VGQFDLYMPFIEKSIGLLRLGGRLAFSVSSSFLRSKSGKQLRNVISLYWFSLNWAQAQFG
jgi:hypothetical protein